jgi:hypothetical protein
VSVIVRFVKVVFNIFGQLSLRKVKQVYETAILFVPSWFLDQFTGITDITDITSAA